MSKVTSKPRAMTPEDLDPASLARLRAVASLPDDQINLSDPDAPEVLDWSGAVRGRFYKPIKKLKSLRIDADVLAYFEAQGPGYQTRINKVLRESMLQELRRLKTERA
nr:BrnA antitoxin family protein [uncultured Rhodopila sp.]